MSAWAQQTARVAGAAALAFAALALVTLAEGNAVGRRAVELARRQMAAMRADLARGPLELASRAFPSEPEGVELQARLMALAGKTDAAKAALREAADTSPRPAAALRLLGNLLADSPGHEAEAAAILEKALLLTPPPSREAPLEWVHLGQTALRAGDPAKALWAFRRSEAAGKPTPYLAPGLEQAYQALGLSDGAASVPIDPSVRP